MAIAFASKDAGSSDPIEGAVVTTKD